MSSATTSSATFERLVCRGVPLEVARATVSTFDPVAYGGSAVLALLACLIAAWIPSRRAVRVDPLVALRVE